MQQMAEPGPSTGAVLVVTWCGARRGPSTDCRGPRSSGWQMSNDHTTTTAPGGISQAYSLTWLFLSLPLPHPPAHSPFSLFDYLFVSPFLTRYPLVPRSALSRLVHWNAKLIRARAPREAPFSCLTGDTRLCARVSVRVYVCRPPRGPG